MLVAFRVRENGLNVPKRGSTKGPKDAGHPQATLKMEHPHDAFDYGLHRPRALWNGPRLCAAFPRSRPPLAAGRLPVTSPASTSNIGNNGRLDF